MRAGQRLAGLPVHLGGNRFPDRLEFLERRLVATGHEGRPEACALLTTGNTRADEAQAFFLQRLFAADRVGPECVAAVDDNVTRFKKGREAVNDRVGGAAGLD